MLKALALAVLPVLTASAAAAQTPCGPIQQCPAAALPLQPNDVALGAQGANTVQIAMGSIAALGQTTIEAGTNTFTGSNTFNGTFGGTGVDAYLASPPPIGGTAPAAGGFTTLAATLSISAQAQVAAGAGYGFRIGSSYVLRDDLVGNTALGSGACYVTVNATQNVCVGHNAGIAMTDIATNLDNVFAGFDAAAYLTMPGVGGVISVTSSGGALTGCSITTPGTLYTEPPIAEVDGVGGGVNGAIALTVSGGGLATCTVTGVGNGYTSSSFNAVIHGIDSNVALGPFAMEGYGGGGYSMWRNIAIGLAAMQESYNEYGSIGIGFNALFSAVGGDFNTAVGDAAGESVTAGSANVFLGRGAGLATTLGSYNVFVGHAAANGYTIGGEGLFAGDEACDGHPVTASFVTCLGALTTLTVSGGASFTATASGSVLTVSAVASGTITLGDVIAGAGVAPGTTITSYGSGSGSTGTYGTSLSNTIASGVAMTVVDYANSTAVGYGAAITAPHEVVLGATTEYVAVPDRLQLLASYSAAGTPVPTCGSTQAGMEVWVTDATTVTYRATYVSGGSNPAKLFCTGSIWLVN